MKNICVLWVAFLMFIFTHHISHAQCKITEAIVELKDCDVNGKFYATIDLEYEGTSSNFKLRGNGLNIGTYSYSELPITVGPFEGDCTTAYNFFIQDSEDLSCSIFYEIGKKCCKSRCDIAILRYEPSKCYNRWFDLSFQVATTKEVNSVNAYIDNQFIKKLPRKNTGFLLDSLQISSYPSEFEVVLCNVDNNKCCDTIKVYNPCMCQHANIQYEVDNCDRVANTFDLLIDFTPISTSDSFKIGGMGATLGVFAYNDLPVRISNLPLGSTIGYEFLILDNKSAFCFEILAIDSINNCENYCFLDSLSVRPRVCNNGVFYAEIRFQNVNTSLQGFTVKGNGKNYGRFQYGKDKYYIGPLNADCKTKYEFLIIDNANDSCKLTAEFNEPICCEDIPCSLTNIKLIEKCIDNELVAYNLYFDYKGNPSQEFALVVDGQELGNFKYANLPLEIVDFNKLLSFTTVTVYDTEDPFCKLELKHTKKCFVECNIGRIEVKEICSPKHQFLINFEHKGTSETFDLFAGSNLDKIGTYKYKDLPILIDDPDTSLLELVFVVIDSKYLDCLSRILVKKECDKICSFGDFTIDEKCEDGVLKGLYINFKYTSNSTNFFLVVDGKNIGKFRYDQLPVFFETSINNVGFFNIAIIDETENCKLNIKHTVNCTQSDCKLEIIRHEVIKCIDSTNSYIVVHLKATGIAPSLIKVLISNASTTYYQTYEYTNGVIKIGPISQDCNSKYSFDLSDPDRSDCSTTLALSELLCCDNDKCVISDLIGSVIECTAKTYHIKFAFKSSGARSDKFLFTVNGSIMDTLPYGRSHYLAGPFEYECTDSTLVIGVRDVQKNDCNAYKSLDPKACCDDACSLQNFTYVITPCENGEYDIKINFGHSNTSTEYIIYLNDTQLPFLAQFSKLPLTFRQRNSNDSLFIRIVDSKDRDCEILGVIPPFSCTTQSYDETAQTIRLIVNQDFILVENLNALMMKKIELFDIVGRKMSDSSSETLSTSHCPTGIYFLRITMEDDTVLSKRIFKM